MLLQVLRLTPEQIGQLPPAERDAILALVSSLSEICDSCQPIRFDSDPNSETLHDCLLSSVGWYLYQTLSAALVSDQCSLRAGLNDQVPLVYSRSLIVYYTFVYKASSLLWQCILQAPACFQSDKFIDDKVEWHHRRLSLSPNIVSVADVDRLTV